MNQPTVTSKNNDRWPLCLASIYSNVQTNLVCNMFNMLIRIRISIRIIFIGQVYLHIQEIQRCGVVVAADVDVRCWVTLGSKSWLCVLSKSHMRNQQQYEGLTEHLSIKVFDCERGGRGVFGNRSVQEYLTTVKAQDLDKIKGIRVEQTKTAKQNR